MNSKDAVKFIVSKFDKYMIDARVGRVLSPEMILIILKNPLTKGEISVVFAIDGKEVEMDIEGNGFGNSIDDLLYDFETTLTLGKKNSSTKITKWADDVDTCEKLILRAKLWKTFITGFSKAVADIQKAIEKNAK